MGYGYGGGRICAETGPTKTKARKEAMARALAVGLKDVKMFTNEAFLFIMNELVYSFQRFGARWKAE
jgi:hypothetical protein